MTTKSPRRIPDEVAATPGEIAAAIEALTPGDWARLKRFGFALTLRPAPDIV